MANKYRGELEITLNGKQFTLRPTFEALVEFEDKAGMTAFEAMKAMMERQAAPIKAVAAAFWSGIKAGWPVDAGRAPTFAEIGGMIQKDGLTNAIPVYLNYLTNALASDSDLKRMKAELDNADQGKEQASVSGPLTL